MNTNPLKDGVLTENSVGIGTITLKMVKDRAIELAAINGRSAREVSKSDLDEAERELTGATDLDLKQDLLDAAPESDRWNPVPGSSGHMVAAAPSADEDEEGRSDNERLVKKGIAGAELDHNMQATLEDVKKDL